MLDACIVNFNGFVNLYVQALKQEILTVLIFKYQSTQCPYLQRITNNAYFFTKIQSPNTDGLAFNHMANVYPQYAYSYGSYLWMDPGADVIVDHLVDVIEDIVTRYVMGTESLLQ